MNAQTGTRPPDVVGGLEVRPRDGGGWSLRLPDNTNLWELAQPRKSNALAVRALFLAALPDWTEVTANGWPESVTADQRGAIASVARMVRRVGDRRRRGVCLGCGCLQSMCACGTDDQPDGPHYTADELAWAR